MNSRYMLPADADEVRVNFHPILILYDFTSEWFFVQRSELHHRMLQFLFAGKNYVGPVKETLDGGLRPKPKVLDLGTGGGHWSVHVYSGVNMVMMPCTQSQGH